MTAAASIVFILRAWWMVILSSGASIWFSSATDLRVQATHISWRGLGGATGTSECIAVVTLFLLEEDGKEKSEHELRERENIIVKTHRTSMPSLELAWALSLPMCSSKRAPLRWLLEEEDAEKAKIKVGFKVRWMRESKERERARRGTHQYWGLQDTLAPRALTLRIRACEL